VQAGEQGRERGREQIGEPVRQPGGQSAEGAEQPRAWRSLWETLWIAALAVLFAALLRTFVYQPFSIPSTSMLGTLYVGDYVLVNKAAYGYSRHTLPGSPDLPAGRVFARLPERGDIVVFKRPIDQQTDYIKRVVGLPGDTVAMRDGRVILNGAPLPRRRSETFVIETRYGDRQGYAQYEEVLPGGARYTVLDANPRGELDTIEPVTVPAGHVFVLGDNRDNSQDSRVFGPVPIDHLVGRADSVLLSVDGAYKPWEVWLWGEAIRWPRVFLFL